MEIQRHPLVFTEILLARTYRDPDRPFGGNFGSAAPLNGLIDPITIGVSYGTKNGLTRNTTIAAQRPNRPFRPVKHPMIVLEVPLFDAFPSLARWQYGSFSGGQDGPDQEHFGPFPHRSLKAVQSGATLVECF